MWINLNDKIINLNLVTRVAINGIGYYVVYYVDGSSENVDKNTFERIKMILINNKELKAS